MREVLCEHCRKRYPLSHFRQKRHAYRRLKGGDIAVTFTHLTIHGGCGKETELGEREATAA